MKYKINAYDCRTKDFRSYIVEAKNLNGVKIIATKRINERYYITIEDMEGNILANRSKTAPEGYRTEKWHWENS